MAKYGFGCRLRDLKYFEVQFFPYSLNSLQTRGHNYKQLWEKHQFDVIQSCFKQIIYPLVHYLHHHLKYVDFSYKTFRQHKLLDSVDQCVFQMFVFSSFAKVSVNT